MPSAESSSAFLESWAGPRAWNKAVPVFGTRHCPSHFIPALPLPRCAPALSPSTKSQSHKVWGVKGGSCDSAHQRGTQQIFFSDSLYFPLQNWLSFSKVLAKWSGQITSNRGIRPCWLIPRLSQIRGKLLLLGLLPSKIALIRSALLTIGGLKNFKK